MNNKIGDKGGFLRCIDVVLSVNDRLGLDDAQMHKLQDILRMMPKEDLVNPYHLYSLLIFFKKSVFRNSGKDEFVSDIEDIVEMCKIEDMFKYDVLDFILIISGSEEVKDE